MLPCRIFSNVGNLFCHSEHEEGAQSKVQNDKVHIRFLSEPNQTRNIKFPFRTFGKQTAQRAFNPTWSDRFTWLHYDEEKDSVFCFTCTKALHHKMISSTKGDASFTETEFRNWKNVFDTKRGFYKHESSEYRKEATARLLTIPGTSKGDIGEVTCNQHAAEKKHNREIFLKILGNIKYLGKRRWL